MNLPELYARVVAKRPDLAVREDSWSLTYFGEDAWDWTQSVGIDLIWRCEEVSGQIAAALILARWVEAMPVNHHLSHDASDEGDMKTWAVYALATDMCRFVPSSPADTPLEALAAFYLGDSQ